MIIIFYLLAVALIICFVFRKEIMGIKDSNNSIKEDSFIKIVKVFSIVDEGILRSMLESADIETKSDSTNFQRIQFGNLTSCLYGINIYVKHEDIDEARVIILGFIDNKRTNNCINQKKIQKTLSTLFLEPALHKEIPELLI